MEEKNGSKSLKERIRSGHICREDVIRRLAELMLEMFCRSAVTYLTAQLREGMTPPECKADFVAAGALYALAALSEADGANGMQRVQVGDVTLVPSDTSAACRCLRKQADMMMSPYCAVSFAFRGV